MSKQCTKPKRKQDDSWFKDKVLLVKAQANSQILHEEELAFLADPGIAEGQATQIVITHNAAYQPMIWLHMTLIVMNLILPKLLSWQICLIMARPSSEQSSVVNHSEIEITSDSNIIPYSQHVKETQQSVKIDRLKQTLFEQLKEKESLMKTVNLLKNDFKKEESRNLDREIALEKKIKQLDNIKPQQFEPKLYDGNVIKRTSAIVIPNSEETLMLAEESHSKMLLKQQDPMVLENKNSMNSSDPCPTCRPTKVEVPKELLKVSMVNTSLKKLKHHLAGFDVVFKERTMATTITEGSWGFEHTKACFRDEIIPFAVEQHRLESKTFEVKMNQVLNENKRLLEECLKLETELLNKKDFIEKETYDKLFRRVKPSTSANGSQPLGNTKKDKIQQTPSSTQKNKHSKLNVNSKLLCVKCNGCMLSDNHDLCVLNFINYVNTRVKSKSVKKISKRKVWKPTSKVFTKIRYTWRPNGRTFTIVGNACPLTRITTTAVVPLRKPTDTPTPVVTLVYSRKHRKSKTNVPVSKPKIIKSIYANNKEPSKSWGSIVSDVPSYSLDECMSSKLFSGKFGNDHVAKILGYGDYQIGNVTISRVYYVEGLGHNLFSVGQFCDSNHEVVFRQHTCFIRNLEGVDLLTEYRGNNLYTLSLGDMMVSSPICLLSNASQTKCWLWHRRLSHLNFSAINHLARHDIV
ncbi:retrovirus-related pol polyprotein from transposon TNT 1-94 [Tanacetum coccineum]